MARTFAIGDIHGCSKTFKKLLMEEIVIQKSDTLYCIGDYIDRGPDSKGVVDLILQLRKEGYRIYTLRGNHEEMMLHSSDNFQSLGLWAKNGGFETMQSFDIISINELHADYLNFFRQTEFFIATDKYIFVHAGLNFDIPNPLEDKSAMLWTRETAVNEQWLKGRLVIHGHTPLPLPQILLQPIQGNINIDGGCVYNYRPGMGNLVALHLEEGRFVVVENVE